jgi:hypothetical protein
MHAKIQGSVVLKQRIFFYTSFSLQRKCLCVHVAFFFFLQCCYSIISCYAVFRVVFFFFKSPPFFCLISFSLPTDCAANYRKSTLNVGETIVGWNKVDRKAEADKLDRLLAHVEKAMVSTPGPA